MENKHDPLMLYYKRMPKEIFEKQTIVTSLRHPLDRALALYFAPHRHIKRMHQGRGAIKKLLALCHIKTAPSISYEYRKLEFDLHTFKKIILNNQSQSQIFLLKGKVRKPDIIIDFTNFEHSALQAFQKLGLPETSVPHRNKTHAKYAKSEIMKRKDVINIIMNSHHAEDFKNFPEMGWKI